MVNCTLDEALSALFTKENPCTVGNVTFSKLGPLGQTYDTPAESWDWDAISKDIIQKLIKYGFITED